MPWSEWKKFGGSFNFIKANVSGWNLLTFSTEEQVKITVTNTGGIIQGSNDNSNFTKCMSITSKSFTFDPSTYGYKYYRIAGTSGGTSADANSGNTTIESV